jgi:hypothetical protein
MIWSKMIKVEKIEKKSLHPFYLHISTMILYFMYRRNIIMIIIIIIIILNIIYFVQCSVTRNDFLKFV